MSWGYAENNRAYSLEIRYPIAEPPATVITQATAERQLRRAGPSRWINPAIRSGAGPSSHAASISKAAAIQGMSAKSAKYPVEIVTGRIDA